MGGDGGGWGCCGGRGQGVGVGGDGGARAGAVREKGRVEAKVGGDDSMLWGFSDDGEPSGTAGKPILAQLSGSGVGEISAVVTRYYGGIRLGTGGLVKAYGGGVQQALKLLQTIEKKITTNLHLSLDYGLVPLAQSIIKQFDATEVDAQYGSNVELDVELEVLHIKDFTQTIINRSGAKIVVTDLNNI